MNPQLYRYEYFSSHGYVVWRDVFQGQRRCSLTDAVFAHKVAVFVCESEAIDYCEYRNEMTMRFDSDDVELIRQQRHAPRRPR